MLRKTPTSLQYIDSRRAETPLSWNCVGELSLQIIDGVNTIVESCRSILSLWGHFPVDGGENHPWSQLDHLKYGGAGPGYK